MKEPPSRQERDPVDRLTRPQLIKRLNEAEAALAAMHGGDLRTTGDLRSTNARLAKEIEERARAEGDFQLALDAAGMGSWDLFLATGAIRRSLRHDQIFGYGELQPSWNLNATLEHFLAENTRLGREVLGEAD